MKNFTSCFKEKKFLEFFFKRLRINNTGKYEDEFPFVSLCGREKNFIRCDDLPIVFTHIFKQDDEERLSFGHAGDLLNGKFEPEKICMFPNSGRVYHPAQEIYGSIGLIRSKLAIELSRYFIFDNGEENPPTKFDWNGTIYDLDQNWYKNTILSRFNK